MITQLIVPNPNIACTPGMCLVYVREAFAVEPKYPTAVAGWMASIHQHANQNFPDGVWVPLWFSLSDNSAGHVALRQPDGSIWSASHPTSTKPIHHASLAELESYYGNRLKYLGWTEDIEDVAVIERLISKSVMQRQAKREDLNTAAPPMVQLQPSSLEAPSLRPRGSLLEPGASGSTGPRPGHPAIEHILHETRIGNEHILRNHDGTTKG